MIIAPSLLAADFARLGHEVERADQAGADWLHLDIMDGHFVPNISFGPAAVQAVRSLTRLPFDIHLLCNRPEPLLPALAEAGADRVTIPLELGDQVTPLIWRIKALGLKVGLALNPPTSISNLLPFLDQIDQLMIMTVNPGFGGQEFIYEMLPKLQQAAAWRRKENLTYLIGVEGDISTSTALECARAGADVFVCGASLFGQRQMKKAVLRMRRALAEAAHCNEAVPSACALADKDAK